MADIDFYTDPVTGDIVLDDETGVKFDETGVSTVIVGLFTDKASSVGDWSGGLSSRLSEFNRSRLSPLAIADIQEAMNEYSRDIEESGLFDRAVIEVSQVEKGLSLVIFLSKGTDPVIKRTLIV